MLTGLVEVVHLAHAEDPAWLVAVQFRFDQGYLHVEVDPDDDTVEVSFDPRQRPPLRHWAPDAVPTQTNQHLAGLIGSTSAWWWVLRNQQGYEDAFQIELSTPSSTTTLQYLAMASRLHLRHVHDAP
ncbi:DUF6334 family protein [Dactylosporangium siamense]|uniref:DUF6334 family protein n=1 Tax=Dactylosporangium siamense TaxID=685454 RepID=UPI001941195D|nr:DUF6334 family protein [Dactylosporangium siamense]